MSEYRYGSPQATGGLDGSGRQDQWSGYKSTASTSMYGRPLPIVFGTFRISGTIIQAGEYIRSIYGGVPAGMSQIALCEGTIDSVLAIWREKVKSTPGALSVTIATGTLPQSPWSWMTTNWPALALGYGGVATASCESGHSLVSTGELERSTFEVKGLRPDWQDGASTAYDASASVVLSSLLESTIYGLAWDTGQIDSYLSLPFRLGADGTSASGYAIFCQANGYFISMAVTEQRPARDIVDEILLASDSVALWSEGKLKIRPLGEDSVTGNSATYTPYLTPQYDLGYSAPGADFLAGPGEPPVTVERVPRADTYNCHPVEWSNRFPTRKDTTGATLSEPFNSYNPDIEDGTPDPVDVSIYGLRKAEPISLRCITRASHASAISKTLTKRALHTSRNRYRFRLGWRFALLEPTDLVTITDATLGVSRRLVRIESIEEQDDGSFEVVAAEVGTITTAAAAAYTVT